MLEIDHVIFFVPGREAVDLTGFVVEPGRVHAGQGTRNVRVLFEGSYLEVAWVEHPEQVVAHGLDFVGRCARPATACPFGCVLRGAIPTELRGRFVRYELPDAPGVALQMLAEQRPDAPFVAVFDSTDGERPAWRVPPEYLAHANRAKRIVRATFTAPGPPPLPELPGLEFRAGAPSLALDLGGIAVSFRP